MPPHWQCTGRHSLNRESTCDLARAGPPRAARHGYAKAECKRWARARRYKRLSACWICSVRVRRTPQIQQLDCRTSNTGAEAPSPVCRRRAESPSPGGGPGRALPSIPARAAPQLRTAGRNEQTSCQSRPAAARPAARKQLLLPPRCRRASTSSRASARARPPSRSRAQTSLPTAALARRGALSNTKNNNV